VQQRDEARRRAAAESGQKHRLGLWVKWDGASAERREGSGPTREGLRERMARLAIGKEKTGLRERGKAMGLADWLGNGPAVAGRTRERSPHGPEEKREYFFHFLFLFSFPISKPHSNMNQIKFE